MLISLKRIDDVRQNVIKLEEVKLYLKIDNNLEDTLLNNFISAAIKSCEECTDIALSKSKWNAVYKQGHNICYHLVLPKKPILIIMDIYGFYNNGDKSIINKNYYYLLMDKIIFKQKPAFNNIHIDFEAGYVNEIPENLKITIFEHISDMYEKRRICSNFLAAKYKKYREIKI